MSRMDGICKGLGPLSSLLRRNRGVAELLRPPPALTQRLRQTTGALDTHFGTAPPAERALLKENKMMQRRTAASVSRIHPE